MNEMPLTREARRQHEERIASARVHRQTREAASRRTAEDRLRDDLAEARRLGISADELLDLVARSTVG